MGFIEETAVKAKDAFDVAVKKTGEVISVQKLKLNIASIKSQVSKDYETLGRLYHDSKKNNADNSESLNSIIAGIESKLVEIESLENEIAANKNMIICDNCGAKNASDAAFCQKCGKQF